MSFEIYVRERLYWTDKIPLEFVGLHMWTNFLCVPVVRVPGYKSRGPGSITGATRLSEK
jgi:hypothetical protein